MTTMPRLVFAWSTDPLAEDAARAVFPACTFRPGRLLARGGAIYVAHAPEHLAMYDAWFRGVSVRAHARLRHAPLHPGEAAYLPVTYDSWLVVIGGPAGFGAALEAAAQLKDVSTVVCPAFRADDLPAVAESLGRKCTRWQDRVVPV